MKIKSINIEQFGKLKNFKVNFNDGINIIYGKNEAGKSTMVQFIKTMLFGVEKRGKSGLRDNTRKRYMPWNESYARGSIEIEKDNKTYIVERTIGKTAAKDSVSVIDALTGEDISSGVEDLGMFLTGVNENVFDNAVCTRQLSSAISHDADGDIANRLANLNQTGDENVSYNKAVDDLNNLIRSINSTQRKNAFIPMLNMQILSLDDEIHNAREVNEQYLRDKDETEKLSEELKRREAELKKLQKINDDVLKQRLYKKYITALEKRNEKRDEHSGLQKEISSVENALVEREKYKPLSDDKKNTEELYIKSLAYKEFDFQALEDAKLKQAQLEKNIEKYEKIKKVSFILSFLIIPVFIGLWALNKLKDCRNKLSEAVKTVETLEDELKTNSELKQAKDHLNDVFESVGVSNYEEYKAVIEEYENLLSKRTLLATQMKYLQDYLDTYENELETATDEIKKSYNLDEFIKEQAQNSSNPTETVDTKGLEEAISQLKERKTYLTEKSKIKYENMADIEILLSKRMLAEEKLAYYLAKEKSLSTALDAVNEAYGILQNDFAPVLNQKTALLLKNITDGKYTSVMVSKSLEVKLKTDNGEIVDAQYLSDGAYDLIYMALRIGIVQAIFDGKEPFYIMDDPFVTYDDERVKNMLDALKHMPSNQILMFTCKKHEKDFFEENENVNIICM